MTGSILNFLHLIGCLGKKPGTTSITLQLLMICRSGGLNPLPSEPNDKQVFTQITSAQFGEENNTALTNRTSDSKVNT